MNAERENKKEKAFYKTKKGKRKRKLEKDKKRAFGKENNEEI